MRKSLSQPRDVIQRQFCYRKKSWKKKRKPHSWRDLKPNRPSWKAGQDSLEEPPGLSLSPLPTTLFSLAASHPYRASLSAPLTFRPSGPFSPGGPMSPGKPWRKGEMVWVQRTSAASVRGSVKGWMPGNWLYAGGVRVWATTQHPKGRKHRNGSRTIGWTQGQPSPAAPFRSIIWGDLLLWGPSCHHRAKNGNLGFN